MRKLMDGQGTGRPGVAGKVGRLAETIRDGGWCEEQGSLMRGLAYGILDPDGDRYRLALIHVKSRKNDNVSKTALQSQRKLRRVSPRTSPAVVCSNRSGGLDTAPGACCLPIPTPRGGWTGEASTTSTAMIALRR
jgi:hypothetical protein